jgi:chondroitin AC lyase
MEAIIERLRKRLVESGATSADEIESWLEKFSDVGEWSDIDYDDSSRTDWEPQQALGRIKQMAIAYRSEEHELSGDDRIKQAAVSALVFWLDQDPESSNWWFNQIGAPGVMKDILALMRPWLEEEDFQRALDVLGNASTGSTGANRVWNAQRVLMHGCFAGEAVEANRAAEDVLESIRFRTDEGIQPDYSFHQHGARLQQYHYGGGFVGSVTDFVHLVRGTGAAPGKMRLRLLVDLILEGHRWMQRGGYRSPATLDRAYSRRGIGGGGKNAPPNGGTFTTLADVLSERSSSGWEAELGAELRALADHFQAGVPTSEPPVVGHRHFPASDFTAYHRSGFSATVKYRSDRTLGPEKTNQENLKGEYLNQGVIWLVQRGDEYYGWQPALDWTKLPGLTARQELLGLDPHGTEAFVGGLTAGGNGFCLHQFDSGTANLSATKAWFFGHDRIVCLGSGISASQDGATVATSVDQRRFQDEAIVKPAGGSRTTMAVGKTRTVEADWLHHDGIGIRFPNSPSVTVDTSVHEGAWGDLRATSSDDDVVRLNAFTAWLNHGSKPSNESYAYALAPSTTPDAMTAESSFEILANTPTRQAVSFPALGLVQGVFQEPGSVEADSVSLAVNAPCLVQARTTGDGTTITVTDPTAEAESIGVTYDGDEIDVPLADCDLGRRAGASTTL